MSCIQNKLVRYKTFEQFEIPQRQTSYLNLNLFTLQLKFDIFNSIALVTRQNQNP